MGAIGGGGIFLFEEFRLDRYAGALFRRDDAGAFVPIAVGSRALDVLEVLVERAGHLVSRDEFMTAVWPATAVEDTNLNMQIAALRRILDDGRADGSCIQTVPGRGYRFAVPVTHVAADVASASRSAGSALPDKPSLAVMPFQNMSGDPEHRWRGRGNHHRAVADQVALCHRAQFELHIQGPSIRCEAGRPLVYCLTQSFTNVSDLLCCVACGQAARHWR
jgi:DNA-binding winged helix-turn-helix (wHTH) protein